MVEIVIALFTWCSNKTTITAGIKEVRCVSPTASSLTGETYNLTGYSTSRPPCPGTGKGEGWGGGIYVTKCVNVARPFHDKTYHEVFTSFSSVHSTCAVHKRYTTCLKGAKSDNNKNRKAKVALVAPVDTVLTRPPCTAGGCSNI